MASVRSINSSVGASPDDQPHGGMLSDSELLAYLAGTADVVATAHLAECGACRARAAQLDAVEKRLTASFFRFDCPPSLTLGEYELGLLGVADTRAINAHLQQCPYCTSELATLQSYLADVAPTIDTEPTATRLTRVRIAVAQLVEELSTLGAFGGLTAATAGIRGAAGDQLVYTVAELGEDVQIIIDVQADAQNPTQRVILGLILGLPAPQQITAHLWYLDRAALTTPVDNLGNFVLAGLAPGAYDLILSGSEAEIHLQNLAI